MIRTFGCLLLVTAITLLSQTDSSSAEQAPPPREKVAPTPPRPANAMPLIKSGRFRALAVSTRQHLPSAPDLPTIAESGFPGYEAGTWTGFFAPARTESSPF